MNQTEIRWLGVCAAVASGLGLACLCPRGAELWPAVAGAGVLMALLGFGYGLRGWWIVAVALLSLALAYRSTVAAERQYRATPWLRGAVRRQVAEPGGSSLRRALSARVALGVAHAPETVALNRAILLGERKGLPPRLKRAFVDSGAIHVFAISGLHVMVMAKILMVLAALCLVPLRFQGLVALPVLWGYVWLIGSPPSAVRAALMASFYFGAPVFWRRPNGVVAWSLAFLGVHLAAPGRLTEVASLFSFVVMLVLVVANRFVRLRSGSFGQLVFLTFAAWAAGVPIAAATFGRLTPGGLLANLVLVSTAVYSVVAGAAGLLVSFVWEPLAAHFNNLAVVVTEGMVVLASVVARLPFANLEIPVWGFADCALWYLALGLTIYLVHHIQVRRMRL